MSKKLFHIKSKLSHCLIRNSFPQKLACAFLVATIVPLFLISVIFYRINTENSYDKVMNATALTNRQLVDQIESRFTQMNQVAATLRSYMYTYPKRKAPSAQNSFRPSILCAQISRPWFLPSTLDTSVFFWILIIFLQTRD